MHRVMIVRHAKSDWSDPSRADHDRPLAPRGIAALTSMHDHVAGGPPPDLVWCSTARRAIDTLAGVRPALPDDLEVEVDGSLYGADASSLADRLRSLDDDVGTVMIVGHNPTLHDLAMRLTGDDEDDRRARLVTKFPTGAIATLSFDGRWADLVDGSARLDDYFTPRRSG